MDRPCAPACERNREPILDVLRAVFADRRHVLEVGSGTGQHAVHFAAALAHLTWQASDRDDNLPGIRAWLAHAALSNTPEPLAFDVNGSWPAQRYDAVFSANTLHIMRWPEVERLFGGLHRILAPDAVVAIYGPFNMGGRFSSESNAAFDAMLRSSSADQGIRDLEAVDALARRAGLQLAENHAMPANNCCVVWRSPAQEH
jgi:cyclopropane fatty-acyl-phospholipid synthase-like methyltransferase